MTDRYRTISATFTGATIASLIDSSCSPSTMSENMHLSDGSDAVDGIDYDGAHEVITLTSKDVTAGDAIRPGDKGTLVIVRELRADGIGSAVSGSQTRTYGEAFFRGRSDSAPNAGGDSNITLEFVAIATSGDPADIVTIS